MKKLAKNVLALCLVLIMMVSISVGVYAGDNKQKPDDPYSNIEITEKDLQAIKEQQDIMNRIINGEDVVFGEGVKFHWLQSDESGDVQH